MAQYRRGRHTGRRAGIATGPALGATLLAVGGVRASGDAGQLDRAKAEKAFPSKPAYPPYADRNYPTRPLFGDTHLRTGASFDAGAFGARLGPRDAYELARGEQVMAFSQGKLPKAFLYGPDTKAYRDDASRASQLVPFTTLAPLGRDNPREL